MESKINFSPEQKVLNDRYIIKDYINSGRTSTVFECLDTQTGITRAVKFYQNNEIYVFEKEEEIMRAISEINSPNLIKCYESGIGVLKHQEKSQKTMFFILEFGNHGALLEAILETQKGFSEDVCKYILLQILNGTDALHKEGMCHRDLKPDNIVLGGDNYDIKLCDFGYSTKYINIDNIKKKLKEQVGTNYYCAPEILEGKEYDGVKVDIFSIGALLFILMTKNYAFEEATINNISTNVNKILYKLIKTKQYNKYWELLAKYKNVKDLPEKFKNLFLKLVAYNPDERLSIDEIKNDEWMRDVTNGTPEYLNLLRNKMINEMNL